jgi:MoaA/NifB/PqqE/SkfB family radical SAM enzyme
MHYDFANLLFAGLCNARCPFCISNQLDAELLQDNLQVFPPRNLERFLELIARNKLRQVVLTGSNTDPQLYRHEARLLELLRQRLPAGVQISLHTNGRLALRKLETFNAYDRVCVSFPSFVPETYRQVMGVPNPPDLPEILRQARIPVKISCVLAQANLPEIPLFLQRCVQLGVQRVVLRKLYGAAENDTPCFAPSAWGLRQKGEYRCSPVYDFQGMQVTIWDFAASSSASLNLFSNGVISERYLLTQAAVESTS